MLTTRQRFPIGIQTFEEIIEGKYAYVDKTGYVYDLSHSFNPYYVWEDTLTTGNSIADMYRAIRDKNLPEAFERLKTFLSAVPYAEGATSEGHFQQMLYVVFSLMGMSFSTTTRTIADFAIESAYTKSHDYEIVRDK